MTHRSNIPLPEPLAYFLTWSTYGTWLPGDDRGWIERGHGFQLPDPMKKLEAAARMADDACRLSAEERSTVEVTIAAHCRVRNWTLHAANFRSNHVHVVVTAREHPDTVRDQLKAWCTRRLKELNRQQALDAAAGSVSIRQHCGPSVQASDTSTTWTA